jgi:hypothetical protein
LFLRTTGLLVKCGAVGRSWLPGDIPQRSLASTGYSPCLNDLRCDFFEIADVRGGETWRRIPVSEGDVFLGDRIYGTPTGVAHVLAAKGEVIVRINHHALPLFESDAKPFPMLQRFRKLRVGQPQCLSAMVRGNPTELVLASSCAWIQASSRSRQPT